MKTKHFLFAFAATGLLLLSSCEKDEVKKDRINFEEFELGSEGYYNGSDMAGGFQSGNAIFPNSFNPDFQSWIGFAVSNHTDVQTRGYVNQYSSIAGSGDDGSDNYAVFYTFSSDTIEFVIPEKITNICISNSTYAYYSMLEGDDFAKQFGGGTGDDPDYFNLNLEGLDEAGRQVFIATLTLADYRFANNAEDYIANSWTDLDLSEAGFVKYLVLSFESSDTGAFGINTPTYVCIDNLFGELQD
jgi:hypothetical protein